MASNLLVQLKQKLNERRLSIPKLAAQVDIPKDRIYKWYQEGTNPKPEDTTKLWNWINGENVPRENNSNEISNDEFILLKKYIAVLEENIRLKDDLKNGAQGVFQNEQFNLIDLALTQSSIQDRLDVIMEQIALVRSNGDVNQAAAIKKAMDKQTASMGMERLRKGSATDGHTVNKSD